MGENSDEPHSQVFSVITFEDALVMCVCRERAREGDQFKHNKYINEHTAATVVLRANQ